METSTSGVRANCNTKFCLSQVGKKLLAEWGGCRNPNVGDNNCLGGGAERRGLIRCWQFTLALKKPRR